MAETLEAPESEVQTIPKYELMLILLPDLGEEKIKKELDDIRKLISSFGGEIYHEDIWGINDMVYRIKKQDKGYYVVFNMTFPSDKISELEKAFNINQSLMRYLMIGTPANYEIKTFIEYKAEMEKAEAARKEAKNKKSQPEPRKRPEPKKEKVEPSAAASETSGGTEPKEEERTEAKVGEQAKTEEPKAEEPKIDTSEPEKVITGDDLTSEPKSVEKEVKEPIAEPAPELEPEPAPEPEEKAKKPAEDKTKLDDLDEKLRSIIEDPDITL